MSRNDLLKIQDLPIHLNAGKAALTGYEPEGREFESLRARHSHRRRVADTVPDLQTMRRSSFSGERRKIALGLSAKAGNGRRASATQLFGTYFGSAISGVG